MQKCVFASHGMDFDAAKGRLVTQSCSLLSMAHTLTHHSWNTRHDQNVGGGSQNKLLTKVSLWSDMAHETSEVSGLEQKITQSHGAC